MTTLFMLVPALATVVPTAGESVQVADTTMGIKGGIIVNPLSPFDQGLYSSPIADSLYVKLLGDATPDHMVPGTVELIPGQWFLVPPYSNVWVTAATAGHRFTAFFSTEYKPTFPPIVVPGQPAGPFGPGSNVSAVGAEAGSPPFPPPGVTGLTTVIPSYLYQQYTDDDDLQGFVQVQNEMQQDYVDTFNALNLPIYTGPIVEGALLDWVGRGLYGMSRPSLGSGLSNLFGPLNTWGCNWIAPMWFTYDKSMEVEFGLNEISLYGPFNVYVTNDDTYRRILTWHFFKTDGRYFDIRFLKRRIWRFLYCPDGTTTDWALDPMLGKPHPTGFADPDDVFIADTSQISILFGPNRNCTIRLVLHNRPVNQPAGGCMLNAFGCNGFEPAWGKFPPWDIGVDTIPSGGGVNWQFDSYVASGIGNTIPGTQYTNITNTSGGLIVPGLSITGAGLFPGVTIVDQVSGAYGKDGEYLTSIPSYVTLSGVNLTFGTNTWEEIGGGGARAAPGGIYLNHVETSYEKLTPMPFMNIFKQALDLGILEVPYQFNFTCHIG
jgi:hypothetical protein